MAGHVAHAQPAPDAGAPPDDDHALIDPNAESEPAPDGAGAAPTAPAPAPAATPALAATPPTRAATPAPLATAAPALAASEPPPLPFRHDRRFLLGLRTGPGRQHTSAIPSCDCDDGPGGEIDFIAGMLLRPRLALMVEIATHVETLVGSGTLYDEELENVALAVGVRGWLTRRAWLEGVAGPSRAWVPPVICESGVDADPHGCDPVFERYGGTLTATAGFELVSRPSFSLDADAVVTQAFYGDFAVTAASLALSVAWFSR